MKSLPKCSLITPTYNWPEALELLLLSVLNQSVLPNEVIIADDGSTEETRQLIESFQQTFPIPLFHIWHEDLKNRKPRIMNKAIAKASCEYIIEIDGDIIMHPYFVKDHLYFAEKGHYLFGSRVNIQKNIVSEIFQQKRIEFGFFARGIKKRGRTIYAPFLMKFAKPTSVRSSKLRGCNMSFWRNDFININGYNENIVGWGREDSEMIQRLHNLDIKGKRLKYAGIVYHIYHLEQSKNNLKKNLEIEGQTINQKVTYIEKGIDQYL